MTAYGRAIYSSAGEHLGIAEPMSDDLVDVSILQDLLIDQPTLLERIKMLFVKPRPELVYYQDDNNKWCWWCDCKRGICALNEVPKEVLEINSWKDQ